VLTLDEEVDGNKALAISATTFAGGTGSLGLSSPFDCNFSDGTCAVPPTFSLTSAESGRSITLSHRGKTSQITGMGVIPNNAASITVTGLAGSANAGQLLSASNITVTVKDSFNNPTARNNLGGACGTLTVSTDNATSSGSHGTTATAPITPSAISQGSTGVYTISSGNNFRLYSAATSNVNFDACGIDSDESITISANSSSVGNVNITDTNSEPASHQASETCTAGSTVSCTLYAWAWDSYGNEIGTDNWSCPAWTYLRDAGSTLYSPSTATSGHSFNLTANDLHIDGKIRCTVGGSDYDTDVYGQIQKTVTFSCGNWSCNAEEQRSTCTVTNNTGYTLSDISFGSSNSGNNALSDDCTGANLNNGGTCTLTVSGTPGQSSGTLTATITPVDGAAVTIASANGQIQSGAAAPNCTNPLSSSVLSAWSCNAGNGVTVVRYSNPSSVQDATFGASPASVSGTNNYVIGTNTCASATLFTDDFNSCDITLSNPAAGQTTTLTLTASNSTYFSPAGQPIASSPNCTQTPQISVTTQASCSGQGGSKTLRMTITNPNTLNSMTIGAISETADGSIINDNCSSDTLTSGGDSCTFDIEYLTTSQVTNTFNASIPTTDGYFTTPINLGSSDGDDTCP
jgi:hypothetical protein